MPQRKAAAAPLFRLTVLLLLLSGLVLPLLSGCERPLTGPSGEVAERVLAPDSPWTRLLTPEARKDLQAFAARNLTRLEAAYDPETQTLAGTEEILLTNRSPQAVTALYLHTVAGLWGPGTPEENLQLSDLQVDGREAGFTTGTTLIKVELPRRLAPGASARLTFAFQLKLPKLAPPPSLKEWLGGGQVTGRQENDGLYGAGQEITALAGFPALVATDGQAEPTDGEVTPDLHETLADMQLDVPADWMLAHPGIQVQQESTGPGRKRVRIVTGPVPRPVAFGGPGLYLQGRTLHGVRINAYTGPSAWSYAATVLVEAGATLEALQQAMGPLPYPRLDIIAVPLGGDLAGVYLGGGLLVINEYYLGDERFGPPPDSQEPALHPLLTIDFQRERRSVIAHELAHIWWGGLVWPDHDEAPWQVEALANAIALHMVELVWGAEAGEAERKAMEAAYLGMRAAGLPDQPLQESDTGSRSEVHRATLFYDKGALFYDRLRRLVGDERFYRALREYVAANRYRSGPAKGPVALLEQDPQYGSQVQELYRRWVMEAHGDEDIGTVDVQDPAILARVRRIMDVE